MKITKIECIPISIPLQVEFRFSEHGGEKTFDLVIVKLYTDEGIVGVADGGKPLGGSQESVIDTINNTYARFLLGEDPFNIEKIMAKAYNPHGYNLCAMATIDFALHDIIGKKLGVPLYKYLGGLSNEKIPLGWVSKYGKPEWQAEEATKAVKAGYHSLCLKVSHQPIEGDIANLTAIREAVGDDFRIGVDANGGWDRAQAMEALKKMEKFNLFKAEQPVPKGDIDGLVWLNQKLSMPVVAHESAQDFEGLLEVIKKNATEFVMFKVAWIGGIVRARKWAAIAQAAGYEIMLGCMQGIFEAAAQAHFIAADPWLGRNEHQNIGPLEAYNVFDTVSSPIPEEDCPVLKLPRYENGYLYPPDGPGLGLELNEKVIPKLVTKGKAPTTIGES